jgi:hypothetical protein
MALGFFLLPGSLRAAAEDHAAGREPPTEFAARKAWERFRAHLRGGHMKPAYQCFSARSRQVMPYSTFIARYSPLSVATQMFLRSPVRTECMHQGDKAILKHVVFASEKDRREVIVRVFLAREEGRWHLVIEKTWGVTSREADARQMLRTLRERLERRRKKGERLPSSFIEFRMDEQSLIQSPEFKVIEQVYRLRLSVRGPASYRIQMRPFQPDSELRHYEIDAAGRVSDCTPGNTGTAQQGEER